MTDISVEIGQLGRKKDVTSKLYRWSTPYPTDLFIDKTDDIRLLSHMGVPAKNAHPARDLYLRAGYPNQVSWWFDHLTDEVFRPQFNEDFDHDLIGTGLALHGPVGSGKTTLAAAILLRAVRMKIENIDPTGKNWEWAGAAMGKFIDWSDTVDIFKSAVDEGERDEVVDELRWNLRPGGKDLLARGDILVVDDLGRERVTDYSRTELHNILRVRNNAGYPTIITTNYPPTAWVGVYGEVLGKYMQRIFIPVAYGAKG